MPEPLTANILAVCGWEPGRVAVTLSTLSRHPVFCSPLFHSARCPPLFCCTPFPVVCYLFRDMLSLAGLELSTLD